MAKLALLRTSLLAASLFSLACAGSGGPNNAGTSGASGSPPAPAAGSGGTSIPAGGATGEAGTMASGGTIAAGGSDAAGESGSGGEAQSGGKSSGAAGRAAGGAPAAAGASASAGAPAGGASNAAGAGSLGSSDPNKKITVWLAGDSTMQPCSSACPCGWGSQFQARLGPNATVVNNGAGGRSIQTWLYETNVTTTLQNGECVVNPKTYSPRWQAMLNPTTGMKAGDYLLIEFGINDGDPTCNRHVGTALFQSYLAIMAQAAKERGAQPIFLTSTSYIGCPSSGTTVTPNRGFGPQTKAAATANGVPIIDLTQLSAALYTTLGLCPNSSDYTSTTSAVGKFFCADHTHFEAAGAAQIAGVVAQAIRDQKLGLAAYLK